MMFCPFLSHKELLPISLIVIFPFFATLKELSKASMNFLKFHMSKDKRQKEHLSVASWPI
jgi:hypothetical protein